MVSNFQIRNMPLLTLQVSEIPFFNFISRSRTLPQFRVSLPIARNPFCLSLSASPSPISDSEKPPTEEQPFEHSFEVSYFINTFGWTPEVAISKAKTKGLRFKTPEKPEKILAFFKEHGFNMTQISRIVKSYPPFLLCNHEKTLLPTIEFLCTLGLSRTEVVVVITKEPLILKRSLEKLVIPAYNFLRSLVNSDNEAVEIVKKHPAVLAKKPEVDNTQVLLEAGVPRAKIAAIMSGLHRWSLPTTDTFRKMVQEVKGMGFDPCTKKFIYALEVFRSLSNSNRNDKVRVLKKYGWSDRDILLSFEKNPQIFLTSKEKIDRVLDFLVNKIGIEATDVANWPFIFNYSLEKRIVPRCLVYRSLLEKGLCKKKYSIITFCQFSDDQFFSKIMKEVPDHDFYKEMLNIKE